MKYTDKDSQHSSVIWPVWLNGWVFVYKLSGFGFECSSHLNFRYCASFKQWVSWHSGKDSASSPYMTWQEHILNLS